MTGKGPKSTSIMYCACAAHLGRFLLGCNDGLYVYQIVDITKPITQIRMETYT